MSILTTLQQKTPPLFRNVFFLAGVAFVVLMLFIDDNNLFAQYRLYKQWQKIETEKEFYKVEMEKAREQYYAIMNDQQYVERYAREKYLMKKNNEDLFVIVPKK